VFFVHPESLGVLGLGGAAEYCQHFNRSQSNKKLSSRDGIFFVVIPAIYKQMLLFVSVRAEIQPCSHRSVSALTFTAGQARQPQFGAKRPATMNHPTCRSALLDNGTTLGFGVTVFVIETTINGERKCYFQKDFHSLTL